MVSMHGINGIRSRALMIVIHVLRHHGHVIPSREGAMRGIGLGVADLRIKDAGKVVEDRRIALPVSLRLPTRVA